MNEKHGLTEGTVMQIQKVLARFPQVEKAVLFGSRAKGVARRGSDIDVALYGEELDWRVLGRIDDALDDLLLPYCFIIMEGRTPRWPRTSRGWVFLFTTGRKRRVTEP